MVEVNYIIPIKMNPSEIEVTPKQKKILKKLVKEFGGWMEDNEQARFPSAFHLREFLKSIDDKVKSGELK